MSIAADPTTLPLTAGAWIVDPVHSSVEFSVRHLGLAKVRGRFDEFSGHLDVGQGLSDSSVVAEVALASVDTNNADRDAHLAGSDFFGAEAHPTMSFVSTSIVEQGSTYLLEGNLTIGAITGPVLFEAELYGTEVYPLDGSTRAGFSVTGRISRSAFGIEFDIPLGADKVAIGDKVSVELEIQLVAPE